MRSKSSLTHWLGMAWDLSWLRVNEIVDLSEFRLGEAENDALARRSS